MVTIGGAIEDVIRQIDDARECTENCKRGERVEERREVEQAAGEQQSGKNQQVLRPLARPERREAFGRRSYNKLTSIVAPAGHAMP